MCVTPHPSPFPAPQDLKPGNLLVTEQGDLKVSDFGLSRLREGPRGDMSPHVVTLWYRAPEVLLGSTQYSTYVDLWSVGCICAEMHLRCRLFQGVSDVDQLGKIFHALGTPTLENWPTHRDLPRFVEWSPCPPTQWDDILRGAPTRAEPRWRSLIESTVVLCPEKRTV